jgi:hypothetical protein
MWLIKFCSQLKAHRNWIICENYTPNGVVVVVDVVPTKVATKEVVVKSKVILFLLFIIHFKSSIFC